MLLGTSGEHRELFLYRLLICLQLKIFLIQNSIFCCPSAAPSALSSQSNSFLSIPQQSRSRMNRRKFGPQASVPALHTCGFSSWFFLGIPSEGPDSLSVWPACGRKFSSLEFCSISTLTIAEYRSSHPPPSSVFNPLLAPVGHEVIWCYLFHVCYCVSQDDLDDRWKFFLSHILIIVYLPI